MSIHFGHSSVGSVGTSAGAPTGKPYETVFNVNVSKATTTYHTSLKRVRLVSHGKHSLHQETMRAGPVGGGVSISPRGTGRGRMYLICPEMMYANVSVFIVFALGKVPEKQSGYIFGNDNGGWDKHIGFAAQATHTMVWGGGWPAKEYSCAIPSSVDTSGKHLISCHWLATNAHVRVNGVKLVGSDFDANLRTIGESYCSLFYNDRFASHTYPRAILGDIYGIKIVRGYLESEHIDELSKEMMGEYSIA